MLAVERREIRVFPRCRGGKLGKGQKPRDVAADEAFVENFVARNKKALNQDLKAARASIKAGRGKRYRSSEELTAEIMTKLRLSARKA